MAERSGNGRHQAQSILDSPWRRDASGGVGAGGEGFGVVATGDVSAATNGREGQSKRNGAGPVWAGPHKPHRLFIEKGPIYHPGCSGQI
jgi:hypothetical protein